MSRSREIYVFLGDVKDGEAVMVMANGQALLPMVCLYEDSLELMKGHAKRVAEMTGKTVRLAKFTAREDVEEFERAQ